MTSVGPSLPGHRSTRPYTIFELEQVRQQSRKYGQRAESWQGWGVGQRPAFGPCWGSWCWPPLRGPPHLLVPPDPSELSAAPAWGWGSALFRERVAQ